MKISTRLRLAVYIPVIMALVIIATLVFSYQEMGKTQQAGDTVMQIRSSITELNHIVFSYTLYHEERPRQQFLAEHEKLTGLIAEARFSNPDQQHLLDSIRQNNETMEEIFLQLVSVYERDETAGVGDRLAGLLLLRSYKADNDAALLRRMVDDDIRVNEARTIGLIFLVIVLATIPLTIVLRRIRRSITSSLSNLSKGAAVIGSGNLSYAIEEKGSDEITELTRDFNRMTADLKTVIASKADLEREIDERKKAEEALKESEERFLKAFHASPAAQTIASLPEGRWIEVNDSFLRMIEYTRKEVIGRTSTELNLIDANERARILRLLSEKGNVQNYEVNVRTKTGKPITVLSSNEKIGINGRDYALSIMIDITGLKQAERLKDEFIGMVSHELKTPLTVMMGSLHTATAKGVSEEDAQELIQEAMRSTDSLASIIENLLDLSRSQADRLVLHMEQADIGKIARDVAQKLQTKSAIHRLNVDLSEGLPTVLVDPVRVERILFNLVENAIKYSPKGGEVRVSARLANNNLVVCVSDQGPGISPDDQKKLFQSFEQLAVTNRRAMQGVGLGLKVCRTLVEAQGGRIWVESEPGKGSSFFFTIPIKGATTAE